MTSHNRENQSQTILVLGAEGGSIALHGIQQSDGKAWEFFIETNEAATLDMLSEEDAEGLEAVWRSAPLQSWAEAIDLLNRRYQVWPLLEFCFVHPDFKDRLFAAARQRIYEGNLSRRVKIRSPFYTHP